MPSSTDVALAAAKGVRSHLVYQVSARILSFLIKALVVRALKPADFAFGEIRLYLFVGLTLLPTINGFRPVALRIASDAHCAALCYFCSFLTVILAALLGTAMLYVQPEQWRATLVVTASLVVRAFAEPPLIFARRRQRYDQSSRARAIATVISGFSQTVAISLVTDAKYAPVAGALGHLSYSTCLAITMFLACGPQRIPFLSPSAFLSALRYDDLAMAFVSTGEGAIKYLLENGEGFVLDFSCADAVKAAYKLASNLGSVMARFFSEALEEQSFNVFHRLTPAFRDKHTDENREKRSACLDTLFVAHKSALLFSVLFALVGPAYSYPLLRLLYGNKWADQTHAPYLLDKYFIYLVFMAANGVSEAFVSASASTEELKSRTKFTTTLSILYITALWYAANAYQAAGIVAVNCANMMLRTCYSAWFFGRLTLKSPLTFLNSLPNVGVLVMLCVARYISKRSEIHFFGDSVNRIPIDGLYELMTKLIMHAFSGVLAVGLFVLGLLIFEQRFISKVRSFRSHQD
ncbi:Oligosaccharide translocation protein rft1 [Gracilariopsis chorda]|uniref:Protein RFT1 homolog n=1 Tax=Gracilariopsis chorda TaxID=448386 RepID=A0A2V3IQT7_9FLOR|nr:Oligosaccharide translocation protein rft1 [Gracilariopsis chorda]|eukprot:PXF44481.1 Oligosaccharide translocation protein rft1 [Gracilariopsis chorda]